MVGKIVPNLVVLLNERWARMTTGLVYLNYNWWRKFYKTYNHNNPFLINNNFFILNFSMSKNQFFAVFQSCHVRVTSKNQVNFRFRKYSRVLSIRSYMDFHDFFISCVFEVEESIFRSFTKLPCSGDLEKPGQHPVLKELSGTDDRVLWIFVNSSFRTSSGSRNPFLVVSALPLNHDRRWPNNDKKVTYVNQPHGVNAYNIKLWKKSIVWTKTQSRIGSQSAPRSGGGSVFSFLVSASGNNAM